MRLTPVCIAAAILAMAPPVPVFAMGSGPHPHVLYGIPYNPTHGAFVPPAADTATETPATWTAADHPLYTIAGMIAAGEFLLWVLMLIGSAQKPDNESEE
jgi:hypothetical protein